MSWWGKVIGGTFGFMLGGPLGAALGAALGHNFDRGMGQIALSGPAEVEKIQSAFFTAVFTVMGRVAKADGKVSRDEIAMAERVMQQMRLSPEQKKVAIRLFEEGKQQNFPLDEILEQFRQVAHRRMTLLQMFMEILVATAFADGMLDRTEENLLAHVADKVGFSEHQFRQILNRIKAQGQFQDHQGQALALKDAYELLGISENASDQEVKKAYRRQMSQHHPDKLVAKGLPQEMMDIATRKTQDIRNAYDLIKQSRKT